MEAANRFKSLRAAPFSLLSSIRNQAAKLAVESGMPVLFAFLIMGVLTLGGCDDYPADPDHSLQTIQQQKLIRVGVIDDRPWVYIENGTPAGIEATMMNAYAQSRGLDITWHPLSKADAFEHLKRGKIDVIIGGLTNASPRKKDAGFTRPYLNAKDKKDQYVLAVPRGENALLTDLEKFLAQYDVKSAFEEPTS